MSVARHLVVRGRVQGVFFRAWTKQQADALGVRGWVRNRPDGSVEAVVFGAEDQVAALVDRLRRGPPAARVDSLTIEDAADPHTGGFEVRRDGPYDV